MSLDQVAARDPSYCALLSMTGWSPRTRFLVLGDKVNNRQEETGNQIQGRINEDKFWMNSDTTFFCPVATKAGMSSCRDFPRLG